MSVISNTHSFEKFISGKSKAIAGQRLAKVGFKGEKKDKSVCVSVPYIAMDSINDNISRLMPYIVTMVEKAQDDIIKGIYEGSNYSRTSIHDSEISIESVIGYLEAENTGGRLTKEYLEQWFDNELRDNLYVALAIRLKFISEDDIDNANVTDDQDKVLNKHLKAHKDMISALSGGKTSYDERQCKGLIKALELVNNEDDVYSKLMARLKTMMEKPKMEEILMLD